MVRDVRSRRGNCNKQLSSKPTTVADRPRSNPRVCPTNLAVTDGLVTSRSTRSSAGLAGKSNSWDNLVERRVWHICFQRFVAWALPRKSMSPMLTQLSTTIQERPVASTAEAFAAMTSRDAETCRLSPNMASCCRQRLGCDLQRCPGNVERSRYPSGAAGCLVTVYCSQALGQESEQNLVKTTLQLSLSS